MTSAFAQQEVPTLRYDPPPNFYRSAIHPPDDYSSNEFNATVQIYSFRPFNGKIAGLYMGTKPKYVVDLNRPVGFGKHVLALHYYLFSADGRVYRAYDMLTVPGGDVGCFDFDAA